MGNFTKNFAGHEIPTELLELHSFDQMSKDEYSSGFELLDLSEKWMLRSYSEDSVFLTSLVEFAQANYSGSHYAFWIANDRNLSTAPIVIFGDEGGYHVVAENIRHFLSILSYDVEPIVTWDKVSYYKDEQQKSQGIKNFHEWLIKTVKINPIENVSPIIENGQRIHGQEFKNWMKQFIK
jgi:hypothetical protein